MGFPWITRRRVPAARMSAGLGEDAAFSPDGALVAWLAPRSSGDVVARERARVERIATGEELCSLPGPGVLRALRFVAPELLLAVRDVAGGSRLTLHELPLGEVVAEYVLASPRERRPLVELSPDLATVLLHGPWGTFDALGPVVALDARTLAVRWQLSEAELQGLGVEKATVGVQLHPDGARVAVFGRRVLYDPEGELPTRVFVGPPLVPWASIEPPENLVLAFQWSGRDELLVVRGGATRDDDEASSLQISVARATGAGRVSRVLTPPGERALAARFSPDGSRLLCIRAAERVTFEFAESDDIDLEGAAPAPGEGDDGACSIYRVEKASCVLEYRGPTEFADTFMAPSHLAPALAWSRSAARAAVLEPRGNVVLYSFDGARWARAGLDLARPPEGHWASVEFVNDETLLLRASTRAVQLVELARLDAR